MHKNYLYENGECIASGAGYYLEAKLSDKTRVTVSIGKWSAHMTFSNGRSPIDFF
jgi:prefoldin subunit 5